MELTANQLRDMIVSAANNLENNKQPVNDLNVFPVPDGDTGTNMSLTIGSARKALLELETDEVGKVAKAAAGALIRGARGNSGVILSLLFRGLSVGLRDHKTASAADFARAIQIGCESAYKAVMKPTEGTILTVARVSAADAVAAAREGAGLLTVMDILCASAEETLAKTPEMLPVLKQAGVVDAGGKGYLFVLEGMRSVLRDGKVIELAEAEAAQEKAPAEAPKLAYCAEFELRKKEQSAGAEELRAYLRSVGERVVLTDEGPLVKAHVHTNNPGLVLEAALKLGVLTRIKVENLGEQHTVLLPELGKEAPKKKKPEPAKPTKDFGFVSVAAGAGFAALFGDLGVDAVIEGGQTMNPSTEDILSAVDQTPAKTVFVLPNNKNIIMAAQQCVSLTRKKVVVLPSKTVPQGISALLAFDENASEEQNTKAMTEALGGVTTMSLTYAARDSVFDGQEIKKGDYLGMVEGKVVGVRPSLKECLDAMASAGLKGSETFVNLYYGEGVEEKDALAASEILKAHLSPDAEVNVLCGGQPVYYYVISAE